MGAKEEYRMNTISRYNKHLNLSERIKIENGLNNGQSFRKIGLEISKAHNTIAREVEIRRIFIKGNKFNMTNMLCKKLDKAPFVCNNCDKIKECRKNKYFYYAQTADSNYKTILVESRQGIDLTSEEFKELDEFILESSKKGHSFNMIIQNYDKIDLCERTLYNYQEAGYLKVKSIDMPRKVRYKKRRKNIDKKSREQSPIKKGKMYLDFKQYIESNNITYYVEMDTVIGKIGGECLLTFTFVSTGLILAYKLPNKTKEAVTNKFQELKLLLGNELFHKLFPIILTDNGVEFYDINTIEDNGPDVIKTKLFFCDPGRSDQKGSLEVTHEYIRRYIEQGEPFEKLTNENIIDMCNNINSCPRKKYEQQTSYDLFVVQNGKQATEKLGLIKINGSDIILNRSLFKTNNEVKEKN